MKQFLPGVILVGLLVGPVSLSAAAQGNITISGDTWHIRTGTSGGECNAVELETGQGTDYECVDGLNRAKFNSLHFCISESGSGLCAKATVAPGLTGAGQLKCADGTIYNVSNGNDNGTCNVNNATNPTAKSCTDNAGNAAVANCSGGCISESGSGCCCQNGTTGCGTGNNCNGT